MYQRAAVRFDLCLKVDCFSAGKGVQLIASGYKSQMQIGKAREAQSDRRKVSRESESQHKNRS